MYFLRTFVVNPIIATLQTLESVLGQAATTLENISK